MCGAVNWTSQQNAAVVMDSATNWYAIQTRSRHEKKAYAELSYLGVRAFLPTTCAVHNWSDRKKTVEVPLFPGYAFVNIVRTPETRLRVLQATGVLRFVGAHNLGTPIPPSQIEDIQTLLANKVAIAEHPFLSIGEKVKIHGGALDGVEGILTAVNGKHRLVISIESIGRSISISVDDYDVEVLKAGTSDISNRTKLSCKQAGR